MESEVAESRQSNGHPDSLFPCTPPSLRHVPRAQGCTIVHLPKPTQRTKGAKNASGRSELPQAQTPHRVCERHAEGARASSRPKLLKTSAMSTEIPGNGKNQKRNSNLFSLIDLRAGPPHVRKTQAFSGTTITRKAQASQGNFP